jgi:fucose permease
MVSSATPLRLLVVHATFVLTGTVTTLLGPILPVLVSWWGLDDGDAGLLFAAQFVGSSVGAALSSVGMTRVGLRVTLCTGVSLMAAGVCVLAAGAQALGAPAVFTYGIGLGLTIPTTNLFVAQLYPASRASALNLLNLAWGLGAVAAPPVVALFHRAGNARTFLFALAAALVLMVSLLARTLDARSADIPAERDREAAAPDRPRSVAAGTWFFGTVLLLYVGTETSVAGWVALYARRLDLLTAAVSVASPALFWTALLTGRALAPLLLRWTPDSRLLGVSLVVATIGTGLLMTATSAVTLAVSVVLAGLGLSTVFPITVALFTRDLDQAARRAAGSIFVLAGLGGAILPPLVGLVSTLSGNLTAGLFVPLAGCVGMLALHAWRVSGASYKAKAA